MNALPHNPPSQTNSCFFMSAAQAFLKTLWEKEKLLLSINLSLFHTAFSTHLENFPPFLTIQNCRVHTLSVWKSPKVVEWERLKTLKKKPFENIVDKGENAGDQHFLLFQQCFLNSFKHFFFMFELQVFCHVQMLSIFPGLNPFPKKPWFLRVCTAGLLKTLWKKDKLLIKSNLSFSHSVFYPFGKLSATFIKFKIVICKLFQFGKSLKFVFWERVKFIFWYRIKGVMKL